MKYQNQLSGRKAAKADISVTSMKAWKTARQQWRRGSLLEMKSS